MSASREGQTTDGRSAARPSAERRSAHLDEVYPLIDFEPVRGEGVWLEDASGTRMLDLYGGHAVASLGYAHPRLTEALAEQAATLQFQSNAVPLAVRDRAADALAAFAPDGLDRVFFVNSGAEANENALRIALRVTGRKKVVAIEHGFHGRTAAAAAVTWGAAASWYGFVRTPMDVEFVPREDIGALEAAVDDDTAAVIIEPVQGIAGAFAFSRAYLEAARSVTSARGALLILDEVQTGIGRLGQPFGATLHAITPDLLTTAKGLGGGFPAGAVLMNEALAAEQKPGSLGTTFGGAPLACAAIETVISTIESDGLLARVRECSDLVRTTCITGPVMAVSGHGLLLGLTTNVPAARVRKALFKRGVLTGSSSDPNIMRLLPPLILEPEHVRILARSLGEISAEEVQ